MDRSTIVRWIVIAAGIFLFVRYGLPKITGKSDSERPTLAAEQYTDAPGFDPDVVDPPKKGEPAGARKAPPRAARCTIHGDRFEAELSARGAAIVHYKLTDARYASSESADLSTTPDHERWRSLRTTFRSKDADSQLAFDRFIWKVEEASGKACKFSYEDENVSITKTVSTTPRPFELAVATTIKNASKKPKKHRFAIEQFAYRVNQETKGKLGRVSPFMTSFVCAKGSDVTRKQKDDVADQWLDVEGVDRFAAVSNYFFAQALVPQSGPADCRVLAERWYAGGQDPDDEEAAVVYHAQLAYPAKTLAPGETANYSQIAFLGPKERDVLADAAGGAPGLGALIDLGFFSPVAKVLVGVLVFFHDHITLGNWGIAIIVMTICLRLMLFPLTLKSIRSTIAMRRLKPEIDALNQKHAGDAQAKNIAMMELWKKHGVNPFGGCLPQLLQMPIWFAMYTTLQTAVEMYHTKFLWFADLSAPDKYYVLPLVLGGFIVLQQRIVPQQGMDPMQQKMMTFMLPAVFTVMMLFLPAALGVYMLTNSALGIVQQLAVEKFAPRGASAQTPSGKAKEGSDDGNTSSTSKRSPAFGKGKARV